MSELQEDMRKDSNTLEKDIDRTRADLADTVDALTSKFSPGELLDQALGLFRQHGGELAANLGNSVKQNPLPVILTTVGVAWLMASNNRSGVSASPTSGPSLSAAREKLSGAGEQIADTAATARDRFSRAKEGVSRGASRTVESTNAQIDRARDGFNSMLQEQPLILGALGIALGAALGAALPRTEAEDRVMGATSDATKSEVKEGSKELYGRARETAEQASSAAQEAISGDSRAT